MPRGRITEFSGNDIIARGDEDIDFFAAREVKRKSGSTAFRVQIPPSSGGKITVDTASGRVFVDEDMAEELEEALREARVWLEEHPQKRNYSPDWEG